MGLQQQQTTHTHARFGGAAAAPPARRHGNRRPCPYYGSLFLPPSLDRSARSLAQDNGTERNGEGRPRFKEEDDDDRQLGYFPY